MRVYSRKSVWYIDYSFNGGRIRYAVGTKFDAEKEMLRVSYEMEHSLHQPRRIMIFDNLLAQYLTWAKTNKKENSYKRDITNSKVLLSYFCGKKLNNVTHALAEKYQSLRIDGLLVAPGRAKTKAVSPATVNRETVMLKHMYRKAVEWGYLISNPIQNVKKLKEPPGRVRYVKPAEWQRLLSACSSDTRNLVIFARHTGLRRSEIFNLQWEDIDWDTKQMTIRSRKNNTHMIIPIKNLVFNMLTRMRMNATSMFVFPGKDGNRRATHKTGFKAACRRAKITDLRFHDLRHTFASDLVNSGSDIKTIQALMGHKNIVSTLRYVHPTAQHMREAIEAATKKIENDDKHMAQDGTNK
jgi:integrase